MNLLLNNDTSKISPKNLLENKFLFRRIPVIKTVPIMNRYLISDFLIGESGDQTNQSKFKMGIADKIFEDFEYKKKLKMQKDQKDFDFLKYGIVRQISSKSINLNNWENVDINRADINTCISILEQLKEKRKVNNYRY